MPLYCFIFVLENKSVDCCKRANIALAYIKSFNGINTFHEKFKIKFDNLIDNDDSETKFIENMWKILDMARNIKLKGASASDEEINEFAYEVGSLEKSQKKHRCSSSREATRSWRTPN